MKLHTAIVILLLAPPLLAVFPVLVLLLWSAGCSTPFSDALHTLSSLPVMLFHMRQHNDAVDAAAVAGEPAPEPYRPPVCIECGRLADEEWVKLGGSWHPGPLPTLGICGVCFHQAIAVAEAKEAE